MNLLKQRDENPDGLHARYRVLSPLWKSPTDEYLEDKEADYFVLRLDSKGKDRDHIMACRFAAMAYSNYIITQYEKDHHLYKTAVELQQLVKEITERETQDASSK